MVDKSAETRTEHFGTRRSQIEWKNPDKITEYDRRFKPVLDGKSIADIVEEKKFPVVVDSNPSDALADLYGRIMNPNFFGITILPQDKRNQFRIKRDEIMRIKQVVGDSTRTEVWQVIGKMLEGRTADLILGKVGSGFTVSEKPDAIFLGNAWGILNENGVLLVEMPSRERLVKESIKIEEWVDHLNKNGVSAKYGHGEEFDVLKITRAPNSPKELPFLK